MSEPVYDVLIVGGGLVGSACAVALARQGLRVGLLDKRALPTTVNAADKTLDSRIYTITPGNADWLQSLNVWQRLDRQRVSVIDGMHIWSDRDAVDGSSPTLEFSAYGSNLAYLAYVLEEKVLQTALWSAVTEAGVEIISDECVALESAPKTSVLRMATGSTLQARLVAAADGANSTMRALAGIAARTHEYGQEGVVANFDAEFPHGNIARQWFTQEGVMAWLPLPENRISLVWSTANARQLLSMDATSLAEKVAEAGGRGLGTLRPVTSARSFPLALRVADVLAQPRLVLLGDAAHQVHPLAGQGVNLGFRDAVALAETLAIRKRQEDLGSYMLLRRYERARKTDMLEMQLLTHGLNWLFESDSPALQTLRNWGMQALDQQSLLKRLLVKQAV